jgi:hypothetical protein
VFRGFGLGGSMMPAMAAAYATLERHEVPRATPMLNVLQRVGGSLGVAIFTVILENGIEDRRAHGIGSSGAFAHTYLWAVIAGLVALIPAFVLRNEEAKARRGASNGASPHSSPAPSPHPQASAPREPAGSSGGG